MSRYLVNARNRAESTEQSRFLPARVGFCAVGSPRAGRIFGEPSRNLLCATILDIISTIWCQVVHTCPGIVLVQCIVLVQWPYRCPSQNSASDSTLAVWAVEMLRTWVSLALVTLTAFYLVLQLQCSKMAMLAACHRSRQGQPILHENNIFLKFIK